MARLHHSSNARETSLTAGVNSSATTIAVDNPVGYPASTPFIILVELGTSSEEIMLVTAVVGSTWTVTRGYDGSTAVSHDLGAKVVHGVSAGEIDAANEHVESSTNVHGLAGGSAVVGTTSTQTLTNKTLTNPTVNSGTFSGGTYSSPTLTTPTIGDFTNAQHTHADAASGGIISGGGGGSSGVKRSGTGTVSIVANPDVTNGGVLTFETAVYTFGSGTWTTAESNKRIVIPATIDGAYWHVTVECRATSDKESMWILVQHETLGTIAQAMSTQDATFGMNIHIMTASADFTSAAGKYLEVKLGREDTALSQPYTATVAIHRIN